MKLPDDFTFSQSSLQDYVDCARRFKLRYIKQLRYPALATENALAYEERKRRGDRFHKMIRQYLLDVPEDLLEKSLGDDDELAGWWRTFMDCGLAGLPPERYPEITLQTHLGDWRLIAKYDLLAIEPSGRAMIMDWKTASYVPPPEKEHILESRLQTTVYRYVLAQAGAHLYGRAIPPENIRMTYWYAARDGRRIVFDYSERQMQADEKELLRLIGDIETAREFKLTSEKRRCRYCQFRSYCGRGDSAGQWHPSDFEDVPDDEDFEIDFDQIAEIEF